MQAETAGRMQEQEASSFFLGEVDSEWDRCEYMHRYSLPTGRNRRGPDSSWSSPGAGLIPLIRWCGSYWLHFIWHHFILEDGWSYPGGSWGFFLIIQVSLSKEYIRGWVEVIWDVGCSNNSQSSVLNWPLSFLRSQGIHAGKYYFICSPSSDWEYDGASTLSVTTVWEISCSFWLPWVL